MSSHSRRHKRAYATACDFCAKRKIKCNGQAPCDNCEKRGRGSSCEARRVKTAPQHDHVPLVHAAAHAQPEGSTNDTTTAADGGEGGGQQQPPSQLGVNAMPSFVASAMANLQDMRPALGLQNTSRHYPFMAAGDSVDGRQLRLPVSHAQILKYSQVYESTLSSLFPLVPRYDALEAVVLTFLERSASAESSLDGTPDTHLQPADYGRVSVLSALLACGAQMSDDSPGQRVGISRGLAQHAFAFARLANFLLRPKPDTVQAMLLLSFFLQNDGQADAAWSLLGTVSRLAMSMGLQRTALDSAGTLEAVDQAEIRTVAKCQDCVLSVCFDRPVMTYSQGIISEDSNDEMETHHVRTKCMRDLVKLSNRWLAEPETTRRSTAEICKYLERLDAIEAKDNDTDRTTPSRPSRRVLIERMTLQLYAGYIRGVMCRPALGKTNSLTGAPVAGEILRNASSATLNTMSAFVELSKLTKLPLRTWSMIHAGLSSAIMVEFVDNTSESPQLRRTQRAFLALLLREYRDCASDGESDRPAWLSAPHLTYLCALQDLLSEREKHEATRNSNDTKSPWPWETQDANNE